MPKIGAMIYTTDGWVPVVLQAGEAAIGKLAANSGVDIGDVDVLTIGGVAPQFDDTDKIAVSLYGKGTNAGDSVLLVESEAQHNLRVSLYDGTSQVIVKQPSSDARAANENALRTLSAPHGFNGATWDRHYNNHSGTLLASAARTAAISSSDQVNFNGSGCIIIVDWTVETDTVELTPTLQIKDSISNNYFTIWTAAAALTATGTYAYLFTPGGAAGSYTEAVNLRLSRTWRFHMAVADTDEATYSVSVVYLV